MNTNLFATHIVGGELYYDYLGSGSYKITLKVYRDCINGQAPFDGQGNGAFALLHIFDVNGVLIQQVDLGAPIVTPVPPSINNPCIQTPGGVCVEEGKYETVINLPPKAGGYTLVYQRCCRNNTILNLTQPGGQGASYQAFIPGPEIANQNSSPRYINFPPIFICNGLNVKFDHKATDPDGDSLVYSLCSPFDGLDACCPIIGNFAPSSSGFCQNPPASCPTVAAAPPYPFVNFISPFDGSYPIASNPSITVNQFTGFLTGVPNMNGQWVVGVCVEEFRNGVLLSKHYRDFQFNVVTCSVTVLSAVADQESRCQGDTITFKNNSIGASTYHWNFGIPEIFNDTSNVKNPTYVYPDTGIYMVTLIANPNKPCADTVQKPFYIYPRLNIDFPKQQVKCIKSHAFNFSVKGSYAANASFFWDFGSSANPPSSTGPEVSGVTFTDPGMYFIKLIGIQSSCVDTFIDSVRLIGRPKAIINNFGTALCDPAEVAFSNGSVSEYPSSYLWTTSDGSNYNAFQPTHTFSPVGVYGVTLTLVRGGVCPDTSMAAITAFTVFPIPQAGFSVSPQKTSIFDPLIYVESSASSDVVFWNYDFNDGFSSTFMNEQHVYTAPGIYTITQLVTNQFSCTSQTTNTVEITPEFRFWIPNTFTPDENNLNDLFMPITMGISNYTFEIFDRWGEKLFATDKPEEGWNGFFKGKKCKQDVYVWKIVYRNDVSQRYEYKAGHVFLTDLHESK
ncbi:MAG: PKD domain-containing protein [Bacteroidia bacterium]